ncbi:hypothetical protein C7M84_004461, partial [Penaeus vannamei]
EIDGINSPVGAPRLSRYPLPCFALASALPLILASALLTPCFSSPLTFASALSLSPLLQLSLSLLLQLSLSLLLRLSLSSLLRSCFSSPLILLRSASALLTPLLHSCFGSPSRLAALARLSLSSLLRSCFSSPSHPCFTLASALPLPLLQLDCALLQLSLLLQFSLSLLLRLSLSSLLRSCFTLPLPLASALPLVLCFSSPQLSLSHLLQLSLSLLLQLDRFLLQIFLSPLLHSYFNVLLHLGSPSHPCFNLDPDHISNLVASCFCSLSLLPLASLLLHSDLDHYHIHTSGRFFPQLSLTHLLHPRFILASTSIPILFQTQSHLYDPVLKFASHRFHPCLSLSLNLEIVLASFPPPNIPAFKPYFTLSLASLLPHFYLTSHSVPGTATRDGPQAVGRSKSCDRKFHLLRSLCFVEGIQDSRRNAMKRGKEGKGSDHGLGVVEECLEGENHGQTEEAKRDCVS